VLGISVNLHVGVISAQDELVGFVFLCGLRQEAPVHGRVHPAPENLVGQFGRIGDVVFDRQIADSQNVSRFGAIVALIAHRSSMHAAAQDAPEAAPPGTRRSLSVDRARAHARDPTPEPMPTRPTAGTRNASASVSFPWSPDPDVEQVPNVLQPRRVAVLREAHTFSWGRVSPS